MLAFCSRPKPLVMKNLTPYLYLTLGREGIGRTGFDKSCRGHREMAGHEIRVKKYGDGEEWWSAQKVIVFVKFRVT